MNIWLATAHVLLVAMAPLGAVCFFARPSVNGLVALQAGGTNAALILLLLSEGTKAQSFADLALVLAVTSFIGTVGFAYLLGRRG